jgi:hypothetical protein
MFSDLLALKTTMLFHTVWPAVDIIPYNSVAQSSLDASQGAAGNQNYMPVSSESAVSSPCILSRSSVRATRRGHAAACEVITGARLRSAGSAVHSCRREATASDLSTPSPLEASPRSMPAATAARSMPGGPAAVDARAVSPCGGAFSALGYMCMR